MNLKEYKSLNSISKPSKWILPVIVFSQFCCTSLWFAGNSIIQDLVSVYHINSNALGHLTSAVQFGFIIGTFIFAVLTITDRYNPSKIFCLSAICGALINLCILLEFNTIYTLLSTRFLTGFFLAGIYPVGMKIASDHFEKGLGKSLSFLVGALVLGTAFPHFLKNFNTSFQWQSVIYSTSTLATLGGLCILVLVPKGPYQKLATSFQPSKALKVFNNSKFKVAAFGYFGHMWELYAFWTFVPVMLSMFSKAHKTDLNVAFFSFLIIGIGALSCVFGGYISQHIGIKVTATRSLLLSFICCLIYPFIFMFANQNIFILFLLFWGMVVIADSPLFSTLVAQNVNGSSKGTALTIVNCIGFSITIISIQFLSYLLLKFNSEFVFIILGIGPAIGLIYLRRS